MNRINYIFISIFMGLPAWALDKDFGAWHAYTAHKYTQNGVDTCNMYTRPEQIDPNRRTAQFNVTNRPNKPHRIAINMGVNLDTTETAVLNVKKNSYILQRYKNFVFVQKVDQKEVIYKMKMGAKFTVTAVSEKGQNLNDSYSLMGFTRALQTIDKYC